MTARALLHELHQRGVAIAAQNGKLIINGPEAALTEEIVARLRASKPDLLRLLDHQEDCLGWDSEDWRAYFNERAAIREHDGGLAMAKAERLAFEDTVTQWLRLNPVPATDHRRGCVHCKRPEQHGNPLLPVLTRDGHVWVHDGCWRGWIEDLRERAREALRMAGIWVASQSEDRRRRRLPAT